MYTLDQVLKPDFPRSWHEAVALVQEVADSLGAVTTVPNPEEIHVGEDGTLVLGFASEAAGDPVRGLGRLLVQLLEGVDAPAALQSLAAENARTPPAQSTVAAFVRALAFFERPDRRADLGAVAVRLSGHQAAVDAEYELQRLRERISASAEPEPAPAVKEERARPRMTARQAAMAAIIVIAMMGTFAGVRLVRGSSLMAARSGNSSTDAVKPLATPVATAEPGAEASAAAATHSAPEGKASSPLAEALPRKAQASPPAARTLSAAESKNRVVAKALPVPSKQPSQRSVALAGSRPPAAEAPGVRTNVDRLPPVSKVPSGSGGEQAAAAGASVSPAGPQPPTVRTPFAPLVSEAGGSVWTNSTRGTKGTNPARSATDARLDALARADEPGRVYSAADPEVQPARLLRSQLPQEPAADARTGYFELLVDESGDVEVVRLISPTHRYQDRILVAAAKAWKFRPAMLHGRPVKYRLSIPIILREPR